MRPGPRLVLASTLACSLAAACGKKADPPKVKEDAKAAPTIAPIATPPVGVDGIRRMNFTWDVGRPAYLKATAAYRAKTRDWAQIRAHAEAAIAKDPDHLDAHRLLGTALAKTGEPAAAVDHFLIALAGDYYKYGPSVPSDDDLKEFLATPHGASVIEVSAKIKAEYEKRIATGLLLVGRRSTFKWPPKFGTEPATSRGELYAFDRETKRYLRLSHTGDQVAGFVRAPGGGEVVLLGFDKIERPKPASKDDDPTPLLANAWIEVLDAAWAPVGKRVSIGRGREVAVGYGPGDQILIQTAPAAGRWGTGEPAMSSLDRTTGKLTRVKTAPPVPRIELSLEDGRLVRAADGVTAAWTGDPPTAPTLTAGGATINVPESGAAARSPVAVSPDKAFVAFATAVDPCAKDVAPSLYVADAKTGALKHLLTSKSRFSTRWLDASTLAYEDGNEAIRLWDPRRDGRGVEVLRLENKAGIALDVLSLAPGPLCKHEPPAADTGSGGDDDADGDGDGDGAAGSAAPAGSAGAAPPTGSAG